MHYHAAAAAAMQENSETLDEKLVECMIKCKTQKDKR
jgi:hypothetical protein